MKVTYRKIKDEAWINDTWLTPYADYIIKLIEYNSGVKKMILDGHTYDVSGSFTAPNGWIYTIKKILSNPIRTNLQQKRKVLNP